MVAQKIKGNRYTLQSPPQKHTDAQKEKLIDTKKSQAQMEVHPSETCTVTPPTNTHRDTLYTPTKAHSKTDTRLKTHTQIVAHYSDRYTINPPTHTHTSKTHPFHTHTLTHALHTHTHK